ncbi:MAG: GAF domain-containing protein [Proteobacteria bacterium]|nr:GAF domain-containing protein [Pseudomonadota bacterium]
MFDDLAHEQLLAEIKDLRDKADLVPELEMALGQARSEAHDRRRELEALARGSRAVLQQKGFAGAARSIFDYCRELIGAASGYVALLNEDGSENEVLFLESGGLPCTVDPKLPMPIRGLRASCYQDKKAVYENDFMASGWVYFMPVGHVVLKNVLFAPLVLDGKAVGLIGLANKAGDFTDDDARMANRFGALAAIALQNSTNQDQRDRLEREQEATIRQLREALDQVKTLKGLLPMCSICKKVRDDQGYWNKLEVYLSKHSSAEVSHGLCPDCVRQHYPEVYEELFGDQEPKK